MNIKPQITLAGTDTPLSLAADDFIQAYKDYKQTKEVYENARKVMASEMDKAGLNEINVMGKKIIFVEGMQKENTVKVKDGE